MEGYAQKFERFEDKVPPVAHESGSVRGLCGSSGKLAGYPGSPATEMALFTATPTKLYLPLNGWFIDGYESGGTTGQNNTLERSNAFQGYTAFNCVYNNVRVPGGAVGFRTVDPPDEPGSIATSNTWVIATAQPTPEPATLTLLGSAMLGVGVVYLRQRRAKVLQRRKFDSFAHGSDRQDVLFSRNL